MKTVTSLLLVALLITQALSACVTRGPADSFVGDFSAYDQVLSCSGNTQSIGLPPTNLGGHDALTFEVEVFPRGTLEGCLFAYGTGAELIQLRVAADPNNGLGQLHFTVGSATVSTGGILNKDRWQNVAVVVRNNAASGAPVTGAVATIYVDGIQYPSGSVGALTSAVRSGHLGYCPSNKAFLNAAMDNFIVTAKAKTAQQMADTRQLIFPFVLENDLIQMWTFNEQDSESTAAFTGFAAESLAVASLTTSNACTRVAKAQFSGAKVTDVFCHRAGSVSVGSGSTVDAVTNVAPFQSAEGGLSQAFACAGGSEFTFNQKWANGGVVEATLKTSLNHRFRIQANPDSALIVEHQSWGGWTRLSVGSGIINEDRSAYSISDTQFVVQAKGHGWVSITQNGGFLSYQFALDTDSCTEAKPTNERPQCSLVSAQEYQYNFANPPLPEPMGNQETTEGIQNLPPVLACPTPALDGYNPFMYCWGWWVGPQVGYARDWNGNQWQTSDPGCCRNTAILSSNQWSVQRWGHLIQGRTLPWCESMVVPPLNPPQGSTSIPTYPTDPCEGVSNDDKTKFKAICKGLWGDDEADGRFIGCVAQLCITKDPTTVPPPDCDTERLLAKLDSNYQIPATCTDCPANCNFKGTCTNKVCVCKAGWTGPSCGQPTEFPCILGDGNRIQPYSLKTLDPKFPGAPVLTQSMTDSIYTQFAFPGRFSMADTLFVYIGQTINEFNGNVPSYHIWAVSGNGAGSKDLAYSVTITSTALNANAASQVDIFGAASAGSGTTQTSGTYPKFDRTIDADSFVINFSAQQAGQQGGFVIRNLPATVTATFQISGSSQPQVVIAGSSTSNKAVLDIYKVSSASAQSGFQIGGANSGNTKCTEAGCAAKDCNACAADINCGWCVETSQCQPGTPSGPSNGECLNWRYTFDATTNRRVTQIPSYPVNPGLTEVFVASASNLPIDVAVTPLDYTTSEWDTLVFTDFGSEGCARSDFLGQIQDVLSAASKFPNMGVAFASIGVESSPVAQYELVQPLVNPRATDSIPKSIELLKLTRVAPSAGLADIDGALAKLSGATTSLNERRGTRKMALFMSGRMHDGAGSINPAVVDALLKKDIVPVFAVPAGLMNSYQSTIVGALGYGYVIQLSPYYSSVYRRALAVAGSSVTAIVHSADRTTTHIDYTAFNANIDRYTVSNVPTNFRARFSIPVRALSTPAEAVLTTHIAFPSYSTALIENIPAGRAEKPWTTFGGKVSLLDNEAAGIVIELTGMSFRGLMAVQPRIKSLPSASQGVLHRAVRTVVDGEVKYIAGDEVADEDVIADGRVVFLPVLNGQGLTSFNYEVFDKCINSAEGTVQIEVLSSNKPPIADMPNMVTPMYTPLDFQLDFGDDKKAQAGLSAYDFIIVNTVAENDGALYQWYPNFDPEAPQASALVTDGMTLESSRLIYMPPKYKYSDATRPQLLILPCFDYQVKENTESPNLESNVKQVLITVTHVNIPPFVWRDAAWPEDLLGAWAAEPSGACFDECQFQEDFGEQYWWNTGFEMIYLGGNDVEGSILAYELTQIDCVQGTTLLLPLENNRNAIVGDKVLQNEAGAIKATLRFRPARETSDTDSINSDGTPKGYYCKISYRVIDADEAVSNEKTITINVSPLNKQPRLDDEITRIVALEQQKHQFFLSAIDPEGNAFTIKHLGCAKDQGVIELCNTHTCESTTVIDCSQAYPAGSPIALPNVVAGEVVDGLVAPIQGFFTSGPVENFAEGQEYNTVWFSFDDGQSDFDPTEARVIFDVKIVNVAPVLLIQDSDTNDYSVTIDLSAPFNPAIQIFDPDFDEFSFYAMTVEVTLDNTNAPSAYLNVDALNSRIVACTENAEVSETHFLYTCQLSAVNDVLSALEIVPPLGLDGSDDLVLKVRANDNGNSGQCPELNFVSAQICPLEDTLTVNIGFLNAQDTSAVTVASSAAAAGVAGAAAIGAVALFRRFNKKAEESYAPWDEAVSDDSTAVNPLYEESGSKGVNPLFEAKTDL